MEWWEFFLVMIVVLPIMALWLGCIIDAISRPDMGGISKALWVLAILFFPLIGSLVYIIMRPPVIVAPAGLPDSTWQQSANSLPTSQTAVDSRSP